MENKRHDLHWMFVNINKSKDTCLQLFMNVKFLLKNDRKGINFKIFLINFWLKILSKMWYIILIENSPNMFQIAVCRPYKITPNTGLFLSIFHLKWLNHKCSICNFPWITSSCFKFKKSTCCLMFYFNVLKKNM